MSVVVPGYRSALSLPALAERLDAVLPRVAREYELLLVDDGSPDASWEVVRELARRHPWVRGIHLMRNYGQHNAVLCGVRAARFEVVVTMDDDLQHPPEEIPALLDALDAGADVVYGAPRVARHGFLRTLAARATKFALGAAMGVQVASKVGPFRAFRRDLREAFAHYQNAYVSLDVLLTWGTARFAAVEVRHDARAVGASNYTVAALARHALNMVTGFSTLPLRLASVVGFGFTLFGVAVLLFVLGRYVVAGGSVPGFPFLASIIAIFAGAQLFALGLMGEYLARMYTRMQDRPAYVVHQSTDAPRPAAADTDREEPQPR